MLAPSNGASVLVCVDPLRRVFLCPFDLDLSVQISYNVRMKEERIEIRADEGFVEKVDYLQKINGFKNKSDTVRKVVEKEWRKEFRTIANLKDHILPKDNNEYSKDYTEGWNQGIGFAIYLYEKEKEK